MQRLWFPCLIAFVGAACVGWSLYWVAPGCLLLVLAGAITERGSSREAQ